MFNKQQLTQTLKGLKGQITDVPGQDYPIGYVRYPVVQSKAGNIYTVRFAGSTTNVKARCIAGLPSVGNGTKVFAIQYGTGEGFELVIIGAIA